MLIVAGVVALIPIVVILIKLKTSIWILLPISWHLVGRLGWLPLPFTVRDLCFMAVILTFLIFFATRVVPFKRKIGTLDYFIYINLIYLLVVYIRNPVGFWAIQTSMVGGRPYFEVVLAVGAFSVLSRVVIGDVLARFVPLFFVVPAWGIAFLDLFSRVFPQLAYPLASFYSGVGTSSLGGAYGEQAIVGESRIPGMQFAGTSSVLALCAKYNPTTLISPLYPARMILLGAAFGAIFLSGFRSALLFALTTLLMATLLRRRWRDLWITGSIMLLVIVALISLQGSLIQLPRTMQRALSWMPGDWDQAAVYDAESSSQWRFEMWTWAWNDDRILRDRVWGQGFGLSIEDMSLISTSILAGQGGSGLLGGSDRENFMITGAFHSGPLSTIKYVGIVGLCLYFPLICYMALLAWRLCRSAYGTKAFTLSLFVGIPIIYEPFNFVFIFGALDSGYPQMLFWAGLLNMTRNYLDAVAVKPRDPISSSQENMVSWRPAFARSLSGVERVARGSAV